MVDGVHAPGAPRLLHDLGCQRPQQASILRLNIYCPAISSLVILHVSTMTTESFTAVLVSAGKGLAAILGSAGKGLPCLWRHILIRSAQTARKAWHMVCQSATDLHCPLQARYSACEEHHRGKPREASQHADLADWALPGRRRRHPGSARSGHGAGPQKHPGLCSCGSIFRCTRVCWQHISSGCPRIRGLVAGKSKRACL